MQTSIVHMDLDTFFVSAEVLRDRSLKGKPVLIGGNSGRAVVASCSYEARAFGVHSAMPMKEALRLCPDAIVRRGDMDYYSKLSKHVTAIIADAAPLFEKASIDEHYLDLTGMDKFFGTFKWTHNLRSKITKETGLPISFGLSANKTVSKIATGIAKKKTGEIMVQTGNERTFLAPLPSKRIPGIGEETYNKLCTMGAPLIYNLQQLPIELLEAAFGKHGISMWNKANGIDNSFIVPYSEQKSMSRSTTFDKDTTDMRLLRKTIIQFVDELAFELRSQQRMTSCITITIRYSNWDTHTKQLQIPYCSTDDVLTQKALELFERSYERRMLIRLIGVKFSSFVNGSYQIDLFNDSTKKISLFNVMDNIRNRFGHESLVKAVTI